MPVSWNAFMDQRLLVAVLAAVKLDTAVVVVKWQELFGKEEIEQPTQRAIVEHIGKLKKTLGIGGSKSSVTAKGIKREPKGPRTPTKKRQKITSAPLTPPGSAHQDDDEKDSLTRDEKPPSDSVKEISKAKSPKANMSSKRKRADLSDEEASMSEGGDVEDDISAVELPVAKGDDDDFTIPGESIIHEIMVASRSHRPRRAKSERKPILINDETTDDDEEYEWEDVGENVQEDIKQEEAAIEEALRIPSPPLPPGDDCIVVAAKQEA